MAKEPVLYGICIKFLIDNINKSKTNDKAKKKNCYVCPHPTKIWKLGRSVGKIWKVNSYSQIWC